VGSVVGWGLRRWLAARLARRHLSLAGHRAAVVVAARIGCGEVSFDGRRRGLRPRSATAGFSLGGRGGALASIEGQAAGLRRAVSSSWESESDLGPR
jgi:hypothetical protein